MRVNMKKNLPVKFLLISVLLISCGCSTAGTKSAKHDPKLASEPEDVRKLVADLNTRMQTLENKISDLSDHLADTQKTKTSGVISHPSTGFGTTVGTPLASHDPEYGFVNDVAVQSFRKAMILFHGQE